MGTIADLEKTAEAIIQGVIDHEGLINTAASFAGVLPEVLFAEKALPAIIVALRLMREESGKSWGEVFTDLMNHIQPGKPAAPALSAPGDDRLSSTTPDRQAPE